MRRARAERFRRPLVGVTLVAALTSLAVSAAAAPLTYVYKGSGCTGRDQVPAFEKFIGRKVDGVVDFLARNTWAEMLQEADWSLTCWSQTPYRLAMSIPMVTDDGTTSLAEAAKGAYDPVWTQLAKLFVAKGYGGADLRIGWEFNGDWYRWSAAKDPAAFRGAFRRMVAAFRAVPGAHFRIVWNPSVGIAKVAPDAAYPGDDVVDLLGLDVYNASWLPRDRDDPQVRWRDLRAAEYGLDWAAAFAISHHKPIVLPEWGTGTRPDGHGFGDDPVFVSRMGQWSHEHSVEFQAYWDYPAPDYNALISGGQYPKAAAAFREAFAGDAAPPPGAGP